MCIYLYTDVRVHIRGSDIFIYTGGPSTLAEPKVMMKKSVATSTVVKSEKEDDKISPIRLKIHSGFIEVAKDEAVPDGYIEARRDENNNLVDVKPAEAGRVRRKRNGNSECIHTPLVTITWFSDFIRR